MRLYRQYLKQDSDDFYVHYDPDTDVIVLIRSCYCKINPKHEYKELKHSHILSKYENVSKQIFDVYMWYEGDDKSKLLSDSVFFAYFTEIFGQYGIKINYHEEDYYSFDSESDLKLAKLYGLKIWHHSI